jgi:Zn-dependent M28 family amino/carboxypeptidase
MRTSTLRIRLQGLLSSAAVSVALAFGVPAQAAVLEQVAPAPTVYVQEVDFRVMGESGTGTVTALVQAVDLMLGFGNLSTSGCEAADFAGFVAGSIALIQRGTCTFNLKASNAQAAGAAGVLIFNQGNTADRLGLVFGTLTEGSLVTLPVLEMTYDLGVLFAATPRLFAHIEVTESDLAVVPTPSGFALAGLGLLLLAGTRRRRGS